MKEEEKTLRESGDIMTKREIWEFDCRGWFLRREALDLAEVISLRKQGEEKALPPPSGPCQFLLGRDGPVMDVARTVVDWKPKLDVALMRSHVDHEEAQFANFHGGEGRTGSSIWRHSTDAKNIPKVGVLSVLVELDDVLAPDYGTRLISGSHRSDVPIPMGMRHPEFHPEADRYTCKAGSILFWNEHIAHWGPPNTTGIPRRTMIFKFTQRGTTIGNGVSAWDPKLAKNCNAETRGLLR